MGKKQTTLSHGDRSKVSPLTSCNEHSSSGQNVKALIYSGACVRLVCEFPVPCKHISVMLLRREPERDWTRHIRDISWLGLVKLPTPRCLAPSETHKMLEISAQTVRHDTGLTSSSAGAAGGQMGCVRSSALSLGKRIRTLVCSDQNEGLAI